MDTLKNFCAMLVLGISLMGIRGVQAQGIQPANFQEMQYWQTNYTTPYWQEIFNSGTNFYAYNTYIFDENFVKDCICPTGSKDLYIPGSEVLVANCLNNQPCPECGCTPWTPGTLFPSPLPNSPQCLDGSYDTEKCSLIYCTRQYCGHTLWRKGKENC